ncbi:MAG: DUF2974 domain-containing protein [Firmicutes bacterium]|nr:DUF2974 domain-containing protein [Bacillota bacterium]
MATLFDYLKWRGDLSLQQTALNEIDSLILSRLSYLPWDGIVPASFGREISVAEAGEIFFAQDDPQENLIMKADLPFLQAVAASPRFANMTLCGYTNQVDPAREKQFAALVIKAAPELAYVSYRGTDLSLAGWKEDFNMSFCTPVPAQLDAVQYLNDAAGTLPGFLGAGGHSKGGNLAVYAASFCKPEVQDRLVFVHNHDGPGFDACVLESEGYRRVAERIKTFIPQSSVVGMLLQHEEDYFVVRSKQVGLMQHDLFSWEVERDQFVYLDQVTDQSKFIDHTLKTWLTHLPPEQREQFVDTLFSILEATNASTLRELTLNWHKNARIVLRSIREMDDEMRRNISHALGLLLEAAKQTALKNVQKSMPRPKLLPGRGQEQNKKP